MITHEKLLEYLHYNPSTGIFTWLKNTGTKKLVGKQAGTYEPKGYLGIKIKSKKYVAHRLAWFYMNAVWPSKQIDHINQIKDDNRYANLREADDSQQNGNKKLRKDNTSGYRGVVYNKNVGKWCAQLCTKPHKHIGYYPTKEEAAEAYLKTAKEYYGEFYYEKKESS